MVNKQNPFSLYDFLGYLIPGALLIYAFFVIRFINNSAVFDIDLLVENLSTVKLENFFPFIIAAYALGHILSYVSSVTIENYANWMYGYPSKYLLQSQNDRKDNKKSKHSYWKKVKNNENKKHLILSNFWRFILIIVLLPCFCIDWLLGRLLGFEVLYQKPLDKFLQQAIYYKVNVLIQKLGLSNEDFKTNINLAKHDYHRIVTHYTFENSKQHQFRMVNYVALYGFLRNLSLIFTLLSWYFSIQLMMEANYQNDFSYIKALVMLSLISTSYIGFMAFMKFYRRYTLEGLMLLIIDENVGKKENAKAEKQAIVLNQ